MTVHIEKYPLQWYVDKLQRGEPFSSLLYGDGEFNVASRTITGRRMQYGEIVTEAMENELRESLTDESPDIVWGTDENLINYMEYPGNDFETIRQIGRRIESLLKNFPTKQWVSGVIWDHSVRSGKLGPLMKVLRDQTCVMVGNDRLVQGMRKILTSSVTECVTIPQSNAFSQIDAIERMASHVACRTDTSIYVVCMGLGAIPLITRLRKRPEFSCATFLDLGSVLDVFIRGSSSRGWRRELYSGPVEKYNSLIESNLKELR